MRAVVYERGPPEWASIFLETSDRPPPRLTRE
jgi:hypothetical protein